MKAGQPMVAVVAAINLGRDNLSTAESMIGVVDLAEGRADQAVRRLQDGVRLWGELDAPYEQARARTELAEAASSWATATCGHGPPSMPSPS